MKQNTTFTEDKVALLVGSFIFILSLLNVFGLDLLGWVVKSNIWTSVDKVFTASTGAYKGLPGFSSLLLTYVAITGVLSVGIKLLGADVLKFVKAFTVVFFLAYLCFALGNQANIAATPNTASKFGITWSLGLTGEAGFIVALVAGVIVGNFMPGLADQSC